MKGLAKRGHNVTVVSPFPLKSPMENYTDIDVSDRFPSLKSKRSFEESVYNFNADIHTRVMATSKLSGPHHCRDALTHPKLQQVIRGRNQFDVVFTEVFASDCFTAIGHILQV